MSRASLPPIAVLTCVSSLQAVNQIEAHPLLQQDELDAFSKEHNIHITAYSPLGNNLVGKPKLTDYPEVVEIAKKLDATPAQVLVSWAAYDGCSVIPKSVQKGACATPYPNHQL